MMAGKGGCFPCLMRKGAGKERKEEGGSREGGNQTREKEEKGKYKPENLKIVSDDEYSGEDSYEEIEVKIQKSRNGPEISLCIQMDKDIQKLVREGKINIEIPENALEGDDSSNEYEDESENSGSEDSSQENESPTLPLVLIKGKNPQPLKEYKFSGSSELQVLPKESPETQHQFSECSICYSSIYKKSTNSCYLECLHWFHFTCLRKWAEQSSECPVCRANFSRIMKPA